jgi:hypothetical protein
MSAPDPYERFKQLANQHLEGKPSTIRDAAILRLIHYAEDADIRVEVLIALLERGISVSELTEKVLEQLQQKLESGYNTAGA